MLKKTANLFASAYLYIIFCMYPLYMPKGYKNIAEDKYRFFLYVSAAAFIIMGVCGILYLIMGFVEKGPEKKAYLIDWDKVSLTDMMVLLYATAIFLSYVFTDYREEALWGTDGWYIGCAFLLLLCGLYFLISRMWDGNEKIFYIMTAVAALAFLLGICNRFSFYPIPLSLTAPEFISTLGNINWYCGYLSVSAPFGIGLFVFGDQRKGLLGIYTVITFMAAFSQGADSVFLWFAALLLVLLWICLKKGEWLKNWVFLVFLWSASSQFIRLMRYLFPGKYNYDADNFCGYCTDSSLMLWIMAGAAILYIIISRKKLNLSEKNVTVIKRVLLCAVFSTVAGWLILSLINTKWGLPLLRDKSLFIFNKDWGNGRGAAFHAGISIFRELPFLHKLFGAGPDCFSAYAYSIPEVSVMLHEHFGGSRLTNAHNELLTGLVNTGILGAGFYLGIFVSFIFKCIKRGEKDSEFYIFALCAVCYLIHNVVSFAQILNLPFVFIIMGMGSKKLRGCVDKS